MTSHLTLTMYDDIGAKVAQIEVASAPLSGAEISVPTRLVDPRRGALFALAMVDAGRWLYRAGPPRLKRGKAEYVVRPDRMCHVPIGATETTRSDGSKRPRSCR